MRYFSQGTVQESVLVVVMSLCIHFVLQLALNLKAFISCCMLMSGHPVVSQVLIVVESFFSSDCHKIMGLVVCLSPAFCHCVFTFDIDCSLLGRLCASFLYEPPVFALVSFFCFSILG